MQQRRTFFINGKWMVPAATGAISVVNPATEERMGQTPDATSTDIDRAVAAARAAFDDGPWPRMSPRERAAILKKMAAYLHDRADEIADLLVDEMGGAVSFQRAGKYSVPTLMDYYADMAAEYPYTLPRQGMSGPALVREEPVGVVGVIVPWNSPYFLMMLKCAPALAAGCTMVVKPAPETPLDAYYVAEAAIAAGLPPGVINLIPGGREAGEHLVRHSGIDKISFTGSTMAGRKIGAICGEHLKRCSLELGGKSAAIVLDDADIDLVTSIAIPSGLALNNGEACAALTRILVPRHRHGEIVDALAAAVSKLVVGPPRDAATQIGPLIAQHQRERVERYIAAGREEGARLVVGGGRPRHLTKGWYVEATLFDNVTNDMRIAREEIFGPVGVVIPYDGGDEEAIRLANDSPYGLAGAVFTSDDARGYNVAKAIRAGVMGVNSFALDRKCPFGGFKASGIGREMGPEGFRAFLETKTILGLAEEPRGEDGFRP